MQTFYLIFRCLFCFSTQPLLHPSRPLFVSVFNCCLSLSVSLASVSLSLSVCDHTSVHLFSSVHTVSPPPPPFLFFFFFFFPSFHPRPLGVSRETELHVVAINTVFLLPVGQIPDNGDGVWETKQPVGLYWSSSSNQAGENVNICNLKV